MVLLSCELEKKSWNFIEGHKHARHDVCKMWISLMPRQFNFEWIGWMLSWCLGNLWVECGIWNIFQLFYIHFTWDCESVTPTSQLVSFWWLDITISVKSISKHVRCLIMIIKFLICIVFNKLNARSWNKIFVFISLSAIFYALEV